MRQLSRPACFFSLALCALLASHPAAQQAPPPGENMLLQESTLPHRAPRFDRVASEDFRAAFDQGMKEELAEIQQIATTPQAPTFGNTIEALERSGAVLRRTSRMFNVLLQAHSNPTLEAIDTEYAGTLASHRDAISLDPRLFARVKAIYDRRQTLDLNAEQRWLVDRLYRAFVRSGASLSEEDKNAVRVRNAELSEIVSAFRRKVLAEMNAGAVVIDNNALLDGLPAQDIAAAEAAAASRGLQGKWVLPLQNTTQQPALAYLRNRPLRERLFRTSIARNAGGEHATTDLVVRMAQLRAERARLLGFPTHAAFVLDDQMAKTPENAFTLMKGMVAPSTARMRDEAARLQSRMRLDGESAGVLEPWDWQFYAEAVRKADYSLENAEVRQYFELDRVLRDGVFFAATRLYGITFHERKDIPVYHPDVRVFDVRDKDGSTSLGLFYVDYFARPTKRGGAWSNSLASQSHLLGTTPVVTNVCNFAKPSPGTPALLDFSEVTTMFHEFGHALHSLFSNVHYPTFSGSSVSRDFVEMPSQFNEHWATEASVFANYARHYSTGEPMPASLKARIDKARLFNEGYRTTELLAAAFLDLEWHVLADAAMPRDVDAFESAALQKHGLAVREVPPRYRTRYFSHIWTLAYSAGYYSYIWSAVLDNDVYGWFKERGGLTRENGQRFRDMVLSRGGTKDAAALYREFRGRDASVEPLLIERGLK